MLIALHYKGQSSFRLLDKREALLRPGTHFLTLNLHLSKGRYVKGFFLMSNTWSDISENISSWQQLPTTPRNTKSARSEKAAFATHKKDWVQQMDRMKPANFQTVQQHELLDTVLHKFLYRAIGFLSRQLNMPTFPKSTKAPANFMRSCIAIIKNKQVQECC